MPTTPFSELHDKTTLTKSETDQLQSSLTTAFDAVCADHNIQQPDDLDYTPLYTEAVAVVFEMTPEDESIEESVESVQDELNGNTKQSIILFLSGRLQVQHTQTDIASLGRQLYGAVKQTR